MHKPKPELQIIKNADAADLLICSVRYALDRKTYIVDCVANIAINAWPNLNSGTRSVIKRDVKKSIESGNENEKTWNKIMGL